MTPPQRPAGAPPCRHVLTIRGGTAGCTLDRGHTPTDVHEDGDIRDQHDRPLRWMCKDRIPGELPVSVCITFLAFPAYEEPLEEEPQGKEVI